MFLSRSLFCLQTREVFSCAHFRSIFIASLPASKSGSSFLPESQISEKDKKFCSLQFVRLRLQNSLNVFNWKGKFHSNYYMNCPMQWFPTFVMARTPREL